MFHQIFRTQLADIPVIHGFLADTVIEDACMLQAETVFQTLLDFIVAFKGIIHRKGNDSFIYGFF